MFNSNGSKCTRRRFLGFAGATVSVLPLAAKAGPASLFGSPANSFSLRAAPGKAQLGQGETVDANVWAYNGSTPGPEIRVRKGERLRVKVQNFLSENTTVHWHGVRTPNGMDGVPDLTQAPIAPGEAFFYEFDAKDAGTFWYHPHQRSFEQVGRGLYAGTAGYFGLSGDMDQAITIRTLVFSGDEYSFQAGAGIVADSVPEKEYKEVLAKSAILRRALEIAEEGL